jgi:FkbM family methyltransferase
MFLPPEEECRRLRDARAPRETGIRRTDSGEIRIMGTFCYSAAVDRAHGHRPPWFEAVLKYVYESRLGPVAKEVQRATWSRRRRLEDRDARCLLLILSYLLTEDSCCVDVGAHRGDVLALCRALAPRGRHFAFEPIPALAAQLRERFPGVDVHELALSDAAGEADFHHVVTNPGYSGLRRRSYDRPDERVETISVRTARLDEVIPAEQRVDFVKIDVEGAEQQVLQGAVRTLARWHPHVVFEHGRAAAGHYGTTPAMVHRFLAEQCGLAVFTLDGRGPYSAEEFSELCDAGSWWNFLARPYATPARRGATG